MSDGSNSGGTVGVVIPTYNERENIRPLVAQVLAADPRIRALIVDDDSPDGTGDAADALAAADPRVEVLHRYTDRGRGSAGREGFVRCIERGDDLIMEMDADFSHDPAHIPAILAAADEADVVLGSRHVAGGGEAGRGPARRFVTWGAGWYVRILLGVPHVRDVTSGFRCFRRQALIDARVETLRSTGPSIVTELLFRCRRMRIAEVPIQFRDRAAGESKFGLKAVRSSLLLPFKLWWRAVFS